MSKIGKKIIAALEEGLEAIKADEPLEERLTVRYYSIPDEPREYDGPAVRAVRDRHSMSQGVFARFLCVSPATVQSWEQGRRKPSRIARRLLDEMMANPEYYQARFARMAKPKPVASRSVKSGASR